MNERQHADAIAARLLRLIGEQPPRLARRLLLPQLRWLASEPDEEQARDLGVRELVERARDEHLASLDADDGLTVLGVGWEEVVRSAATFAEPARPVRCPRCGARLPRRGHCCSRCRLPVPR